MDVKKIMIIFIIAAILIISVCAIVAATQNNDQVNGEYNYKVEYKSSFVDRNGITQYAPEGKMFAVVDVTLKNSNYGAGISTSPAELVWRFTLDKITYNANIPYTELNPGYWAGITVEQGRTWTYTIVFEVSEQSIVKKDVNLRYNYVIKGDLRLNYNKDLVQN